MKTIGAGCGIVAPMTFQVPRALLDGVIARFDPVEVYLFGSHARGDAHPDSDIDLYVVLDDHQAKGLDVSQAIGEARCGVREAVDIVLATRSSHSRFRATPGAMARTVDLEGVRLYARG